MSSIKIIIGAHGGGAFSGKDPTKVDRTGAYAARWVAKSLVKSGLCKRCLVQVRIPGSYITLINSFKGFICDRRS